ncbi:putative serine/threonine-protein kinase pats1 [Monoraphidium neglectum]|uniref:Putative serine/threonine-protein kinase pats1 n=1 Tax=Monoraphidium neglectum TaxID=145388 RepID=A0A0D2NML0_9CHLO|nr:putative serine/threonine-protein kinase pats1 [Monoraphidium neglectum]KIZ05851.1 putative serine/threonine-protein kinase pats1 [Monoraphidium neglectum]|eukprot:XP_013904870.1 putative serine/threonine-protein kinase pats1 [Monoraphidium neglectum]
MGNCGSSPAVEDSGACDSAERDAAALKPALKKGAPCVTSAEARRSPPSAMSSVGGRSLEALQQELALISSHALLALPDAAEVVAQHVKADAVGIFAFADDEPSCAALLAAAGSGAAALERNTVVRGAGWSTVRLADSGAGRLAISDSSACEDSLPLDIALLHAEAGLRSYLAAAIGPKDHPLGVLLLARERPGAFDDRSSHLWLSAAATGLLQHVRPAQVAQAVRMMRAIDDAGDPVSAISAVLQSAGRFMWRATNICMGVRLALVEDDGANALVFESERATACKGDPNVSTGRSVVLSSNPSADVNVRELKLERTLLASAVLQRKARFIKDCASYMQNCPSPARDVFTHASQAVSSLVVVPLIMGEESLGALYFTQETPCDFSNIQDALLGFVHSMTLTLWNKLSGEMDMLKLMVEEVERNSILDLSSVCGSIKSPRGSNRPPGRAASRTSSEFGADAAGGTGGGALPPHMGTAGTDDSSDSHEPRDVPAGPVSARLSKVSSSRLCTEAMLKVLQQEIRKNRRRSSLLSFQSDLVIHEPLGRGGFGHVYRGTWHTTPAAVKVMNARASDMEAVSDAMEMAVLSSVQHPNIVQVYCCLTDMIEVKGDEGGSPRTRAADASVTSGGSGPDAHLSDSARSAVLGGAAPPRYRRALPGEELGEDARTYNIVVMEYCDRGTLKAAVQAGVFHQPLEGGAIGVDLAAVVSVLLDVAHSLQYIHRMHLLHSDVKLDNVLLKSDPSRPSGVTPKLADFGLAKILKEDEHVINHSGAGTVTHLAPEMFRAGSHITTAVDVYAFGIMMWEFYTQKKPYANLARDAIIARVLKGARPSFPSGPPQPYVQLASACWATDPAMRPAVADIITSLQRMAADMAH